MKRVIILTVFICWQIVAVAQSQNTSRRLRERVPIEERAERQTQLMQDSLKLSEAQIVAVKEINLKYIKEREVLIKKDLSRQEKMFDMETLEIKQQKEFKKILSKEQFKRLKLMEERRREMRQKRFRERRSRQGN